MTDICEFLNQWFIVHKPIYRIFTLLAFQLFVITGYSSFENHLKIFRRIVNVYQFEQYSYK